MGNWEYKEVINVNYRLNELGGQGWELCAINGNIFYFKRPMQCENCKYYKPSQYQGYKDC